MKERTLIGIIVSVLALIGLAAATNSTDVIFVCASIVFFTLCLAYAAWCERL